jgi:hypothetical protein
VKGAADGLTSNRKIRGQIRSFALPFSVTKWLMSKKKMIGNMNTLITKGKLHKEDTEEQTQENIRTIVKFFNEFEDLLVKSGV